MRESSMRAGAAWWVVVLLMALSTWAVQARAVGPWPAAGAPAAPMSPGRLPQSWVLIPLEARPSEPSRWTIQHLPPRSLDASGASTPAEGTLRAAHLVQERPLAVAALEDALYLLFDPPMVSARERVENPPEPMRQVLSLQAVEVGEGLWASQPMGRLEARPPLVGRGPILGFAGTTLGLVALTGAEDATAPALRLRVLTDRGWEERTLPAEAQAIAAGAPAFRAALLSKPRGLLLLLTPPDGRLVAFAASTDSAAPSELIWSRYDLGSEGWLGTDGDQAPAAAPTFVTIRDELVAVTRADDGLVTIRSRPLAPGPWRVLNTLENVPESFGVVPMEDSARVALVWLEWANRREAPEGQPPFPSTLRADTRVHLAEFSSASGRLFVSAPAAPFSPISRQDFHLLAMVLVGVMAAVLVFVLRPPRGDDAASLPKDAALADGVRRLVASMIDLAIVLTLTAVSLDTSILQIISPLTWISGDGLVVLMVLIATGVLQGTILEGLTGRTLGKMITGCGVVRMNVDELQAPGFARAFVRNMVKWCLPPVALLGLLDPTMRHRGDQFAGTAVVVPLEPNPGE